MERRSFQEFWQAGAGGEEEEAKEESKEAQELGEELRKADPMCDAPPSEEQGGACVMESSTREKFPALSPHFFSSSFTISGAHTAREIRTARQTRRAQRPGINKMDTDASGTSGFHTDRVLGEASRRHALMHKMASSNRGLTTDQIDTVLGEADRRQALMHRMASLNRGLTEDQISSGRIRI